MLNRILDIAETPARLKVSLGRLVVDTKLSEQPVTIPISEIAVLIVSHPQVSYSQAVLSSIVDQGAVFISCDDRRLPNGMLIPIQGNHVQTERFARQSDAKSPLKKRIWQQVVRAKILAQAELLRLLHDNDFGLFGLVSQVKSGDPQNIEARAARKYWRVLFGSNTFRRDRTAHDQNQFLNYGYAILRAITARAVCAAGLHPSIGIHHHNKYNPFCLADDLMEPFRVLIDHKVAIHIHENGIDSEFDHSTREILLSVFTERIEMNGQSRTLFDTIAHIAQSLNDVFAGNKNKIDLPEKIFAYATS